MSGTAYYDCDNANESLESVVRRTLAFEDGNPFVRISSSFPFKSDLVFDYDTRTNLNLVDNIANENALIHNFVVGDYVPASLPSINLGDRNEFSFGDSVNDSPFWISAWIYMRDATNFRIMGKVGAANPNREWLFQTGGTDVLTFNIFDQNFEDRRGRLTAALTALENTWIHVMACYNGVGGAAANNGIDIYVNTVISDIADANLGNYTAMHNTNSNLYVGLFEFNNTYADGMMYDARIGTGVPNATQRATIMAGGFIGTEIEIQEDCYSGIDISGNNFHGTVSNVIKGYGPNPYKFNRGFTQYYDNATGLISLQSPYNVAGVPINPANITHDGTLYNRSENHPTNAFHNLAESFIDFNPTNSGLAKFNIFNRSNAAIFNANARVALPVGFYNAAGPWTFHISELSQLILGRNYYQIGEAGKHFVEGFVASIGQADRDYLERIFVYGTDKTSFNEFRVLDFTNDITHAQGLNPATPSGYIEDANGYIILI